ncbi:hypothetical protein [Streptomyces collinus]|uniref:ISAzo13-like element transposase-related protein n=1 Tax=Streptomyces collinus TaxID=42684 RepID=UPI003687B910
MRGDHGTAALAVASMRRCRQTHGRHDPLAASRLLITADVDGSGRYHCRPWKAELAAFAAETGLMGMSCHFPPGALRSGTRCSKHRLFSHITMNWRGRTLTSHEADLNSIGPLDPDRTARRGRPRLRSLPDRYRGQPRPARAPTNHRACRPRPGGTTASPRQAAPPPHRAPTNAPQPECESCRCIQNPFLTGMSTSELGALQVQLTPVQASQAEHCRSCCAVPSTSP